MLNPTFKTVKQKGGISQFLLSYIPICDAIVSVFGEGICEVVLHDLTDPGNSIVYINGTLTNRKIGAPVTNVLLQKFKLAQKNEGDNSYYLTKHISNKTFKSSTTFIRDDQGVIVGCICINYDISDIQSTVEFLNNMIGDSEELQHSSKTYHEDSKSLVYQMIKEICVEHGLTKEEVVTKEQKMNLVRLLEEKGVFSIKKGVIHVSDFLGVSRITVYNYLKQLRGGK